MITPYSNIISVTTLSIPLLDDYPNAAAAYSLRKLRSAYTGSAIKVRRSVGSPSEKDIGFVNNELDVADLESFCSGTDGFVVTWYDQSGNGRDATQATASNQPKIVSSGSVILENGKPSLSFDGTDDFLDVNDSNLPSFFDQSFLLNLVSKPTNINTGSPGLQNKRILFAFLNNIVKLQLIINESSLDKASSQAGYLSATNGNFFTLNQTLFTYDTAADEALSNGVIKNTGTVIAGLPTPLGTGLRIGGSKQGDGINGQFVGIIQEIVIYNSDQSSNRTGIETNINDFYNIY